MEHDPDGRDGPKRDDASNLLGEPDPELERLPVLLVAAGARWWLRASRRDGGGVFAEASPLDY